MLVVVDTNILVSSLWSRNGAPAQIVNMILTGSLTPCYDQRILTEYKNVLSRPKFSFTSGEINALIEWIEKYGLSVVPKAIDIPFSDEADKKFLEVAKFCNAKLITGNIKHFPADPLVVTTQQFLENLSKSP